MKCGVFSLSDAGFLPRFCARQFTGGIATYLVILLQFELADGPVGFASVVNTVRGNQTLTSNWMAGTKRPK